MSTHEPRIGARLAALAAGLDASQQITDPGARHEAQRRLLVDAKREVDALARVLWRQTVAEQGRAGQSAQWGQGPVRERQGRL